MAPDIHTDARCAAFVDVARRAGIASVWSEPVVSRSGAVLGTLGVYRRQPHEPQADEMASVADAARVAAIAIERHLADNALRESQKMEALGTLAGGIAHDFNNILGAILGNVELARREVPSSLPLPTAARLAQIEQSAQRARQLVRQILAFSRRQPRQAVRQRLRPIVEEALSWQRVSLPPHVQLKALLGDGLLSAEVDETQVQQVVMNLCSNAWHALAGRAGTVEIGLEALSAKVAGNQRPAALPTGPLAHLWVRDTGSGMDETTRARIFDPFFTTKPVGSGTGLGLAVVHGIVSEHKGLITVDSAPGVGSTFHVYLPGARSEGHAPSADESAPPRADAEAPPARHAAHILFVDDDAVMLITGEGLLLSLGYRVTTLDNGPDALEAVRQRPEAFDGVVADYNMPGFTGLDLARGLAAVKPDLPVLICSGYIDPDLRDQALAVGVRALVRKESAVEELGPAVEHMLKLGSGVHTGLDRAGG
jgi:signal transduction histidine kinase/CheY-like chemotaxis protein